VFEYAGGEGVAVAVAGGFSGVRLDGSVEVG